MNYKALIAASLMSIAVTSAASAQCVSCALYPDRDYLNDGAPTPASKMTRPGSTAGASTGSAYDAHAEARVPDESVRTNSKGAQHRHFRDANASMAESSVPADSFGVAHDMRARNLQDSGYNPAGDFNAAGNMKTN
jgi:hypothetical protein